tara:strand:+ start:261 stop:932 length:672 start_codon:yes stop_codon:yes gene_type:complete
MGKIKRKDAEIRDELVELRAKEFDMEASYEWTRNQASKDWASPSLKDIDNMENEDLEQLVRDNVYPMEHDRVSGYSKEKLHRIAKAEGINIYKSKKETSAMLKASRLTKKQKEMIRDTLDLEYFDNPHPYWTLRHHSNNLFFRVKDAGIDSSRSGTYASEIFSEHYEREVRDWIRSQDDEITIDGRKTTVGKERVRKNMEKRQKGLDRIERRKDILKSRELIF